MRMFRGTALVLAALTAGCSGGTTPSADPYAVIWTQVRFTQPPRDSLSYLVYLIRVNQPSTAWSVIGSHGAGLTDQSCSEFNGIPEGGPNDSLLSAIALVSTDHWPNPGSDTVRSGTFQPLTGPTQDSARVWKIVFTDSGSTITELPQGTVCGQN